MSPFANSVLFVSRPARGAWIEIDVYILKNVPLESRPARGAWIEILIERGDCYASYRRAPQGARGLKWKSGPLNHAHTLSRPARGAWIEIRIS